MTSLASTKEQNVKCLKTQRHWVLLYFIGSVIENAGHCKCCVFLMKIERRFFSSLLESGLDGLLQFGFSSGHLEACDGLLALLFSC